MPSAALAISKELVGEPPGGDNKGDPMAIGIKLGPEVGEPPGGDPMVIGNELGSVVGEPPGNGHKGTPLAIGIELGSVVDEPPGGDMVTGIELGSVVGEPRQRPQGHPLGHRH